MNAIKTLSIVGILAMLGGIVATIASGTFGEDAATFGTPLGITSLIDLYLGLLLIWAWVAYRERNLPRALFWLVLFIPLGNLGSAIYVLIAAFTSNGNWQTFFHGQRS